MTCKFYYLNIRKTGCRRHAHIWNWTLSLEAGTAHCFLSVKDDITVTAFGTTSDVTHVRPSLLEVRGRSHHRASVFIQYSCSVVLFWSFPVDGNTLERLCIDQHVFLFFLSIHLTISVLVMCCLKLVFRLSCFIIL